MYREIKQSHEDILPYNILKMGYSPPLFLFFLFLNTVGSKEMLIISIADDWLWTVNLCWRKQPLCQLS